jgi:GTPase SAR1 family protein
MNQDNNAENQDLTQIIPTFNLLSNMQPTPRELVGDIEKTIIVISGQGKQGKTTLCANLCSDKIHFISMDDLVSIHYGWCNIPEVTDYIKTFAAPRMLIYYINDFINNKYSYEFTEQVFKNFILNNHKKHFLTEGHFFTLANNKKHFINLCKQHKIRLWFTERLV